MSTPRQRRSRRRQHRGTSPFALRHGDELLMRRAPIPTTRCPHGKRRYYTRLDAEVVLVGLRRDPARREQRSYECPTCHGWHLTSMTLDQYNAQRYARQSARTQTRPPSTLAVPPQPTPTPADVSVQLEGRTAAPILLQQNSALPRLRALLRRVWQHLVVRTH